MKKITINKTEEIELTERENLIWVDGYKNGKNSWVTWALIACFVLFFFTLCSKCSAQPSIGKHLTQTFVITPAGHWQAQGNPYYSPDTLTTIHAYKWKRERIVAIQDYKKVNGKWVKYGEPYPTPDTLKLVHGFIR